MSVFATMSEQVRFDPTVLLSLFVLDGTAIGLSTVYYFCNATNQNFQPVVFNGISYTPFPIQMTDAGNDGKGSIVRPKITVSNINGFISNLLLQNQQLNGATVIRRRVFGRFIDAVNFPGSLSPYTPNTSAAYPDENWVINRKISENPQFVQWELTPPFDVQGVKIPRRQIIANICAAPVKYRDARTCGYSGVPVADSKNKPFGAGGYGYTLQAGTPEAYSAAATYNQGDYVYVQSTLPQFTGIKIYYVCTTNSTVGINPVGNPARWIGDTCAKSPAACKLRFTGGTPLRGGFFPGVTRSLWIRNQ